MSLKPTSIPRRGGDRPYGRDRTVLKMYPAPKCNKAIPVYLKGSATTVLKGWASRHDIQRV